MIVGVPLFAVLHAAFWKLIGHSLNERKIPDTEETYFNIDCLDTETGETIPLVEEPSKRRQEMRNPDGFFMKFWNIAMKILTPVWLLLRKWIIKLSEFIDKFLTKAYHFLKEKSKRICDWIAAKSQTLYQKACKIYQDYQNKKGK
jgi:hypothetical protein